MRELQAPSGRFTLSDANEDSQRIGHWQDTYRGEEGIDFTAFVSCYNEANYIAQTLLDVTTAFEALPFRYEIVVIDDGSRDGSAEVVKDFMARHPHVRILLRVNSRNVGLAQNYIDAAFMGRGRYYKLFCGDNTEPPESIRQICALAGTADVIVPNYRVSGRSLGRVRLSAAYTGLVNLVSGHQIRYYNGLHVHLRYNIMRWHPNTRGFGFQADILCQLLDQGASVRQITVDAVNRAPSRALTSKNFLSVGHTLLDLAIRRVARWVYR